MNNSKYSIHKIVWFNEKLSSLMSGRITPPIYVRIKPTNRCNHDCFYCVYKKSFSGMHELSKDRETGFNGKPYELTRKRMLELIGELSEMEVRAITFSGGGEPLMHPDIAEVMNYVWLSGIDLSIITNGQLLNGDRAAVLCRAKWVRVSIDYNTAEDMHKSRGVPERLFASLYSNLRKFAAIKPTQCELTCNFVVHKGNYIGIVDTAKRLKDHGVQNVRFSPMWTTKFIEYHSSIKEEVDKRLCEIQKICDKDFTVNSSYDINSSSNSTTRRYNRCLFMQVVPVIGADGNIYACHNKAYDKNGLIGNVLSKKFSDVWFSKEAEKVFAKLNPSKDCKHQCANDSKNLFMHSVIECFGDNFV